MSRRQRQRHKVRRLIRWIMKSNMEAMGKIHHDRIVYGTAAYRVDESGKIVYIPLSEVKISCRYEGVGVYGQMEPSN